MTTIILLFIGTFIYLELNTPQCNYQRVKHCSQLLVHQNHFITNALPETIPSVLASIVAFLNLHMFKIFAIWLIGVTLLFARLIGSFWYIEKLKSNSSLLSGTLLEHLNQLAYQLHIPQWIDLAENPSIHSPLVVGVFKPLILVPAGMLTGLSTEQVESIFIHELTHIKRHDYLVNIIQSIVEVVLFFNPFVLMLSNILRKERENCCDDVVLNQLNNPTLYAKTLAQLEEYKYTNNQLAISFAGNKNYLLNRIKRIMEHTAKKQNGKGWLLPVILLVVGMISASWLSFTPGEQEPKEIKKEDIVEIPSFLNPVDTDTIKPVMKEPPLPNIYEPKEVDAFEMVFEPTAFSFDNSFDFSFNYDFEPPVFEMNPFEFDFEPMEFNFSDTIPPNHWDNFGENFNSTFNKEYAENMTAMRESMRALEETLMKLRHEELISQEVQEKIQRIEKIQQERLQNLEKIYVSEVMEKQQEKMREVQEKMKAVEKIQKEKFVQMEQKMRAFEKVMSAYEKELKEELVKDGYIKKDEEVSIRWQDEVLEINGKKIKDKDKEKYKALQKKYFKDGNMKMNWE